MEELAAATTDDHHRVRDRDRDDEEDRNNSKKMKMTEDERKEMPLSDSIAILKAISSHLPLFSVLRFLFVSKDWYTVLSNRDFLQQHALRFHSKRHNLDEPPGALICPSGKKHPVYAIISPNQELEDINRTELKLRLDHVLPRFKKLFPGSLVIGSCNGLLLYCDSSYRCTKLRYKVYNPMINQHKEIPLIDLSQSTFEYPDETNFRELPYLLFDPSISLSFQVLSIFQCRPFKDFQIHVYSSQTENWRYIDTIPHDEQRATRWEFAMFNGVFYIVRDHDVICFDARNDTVFLLKLPEMPEGNTRRDVLYIGECRGRLLLMEEFDVVDHRFPFTFTIFEMQDVPGQAKTWIERFRVNLDVDPFNPESEIRSGIQLMHLYETEEGDEALLLNINHRRLVSFSLTAHTFGAELKIPYLENSYGLTAYPFSPTLFPLDTSPEI